MRDLLTPEETAQLLGVSAATVYRLIKGGALKSEQTPNGMRCSLAWLMEKFGPALPKKISTGLAEEWK